MNRRQLITALASALALPAGLAVARPGASHANRVLLQESPIAGFQYHQGEHLWAHLRVGHSLRMVREVNNPYDRRAVGLDWRGYRVGYIPRADNATVAQMLDRGEPLACRITHLCDSRNPRQRIRIAVDLWR